MPEPPPAAPEPPVPSRQDEAAPPGADPALEVVFQPLGRRARAGGGSLLDLARATGLDMEGTCGGKGLCGKCLVRLDGPEPPPATDTERETLGSSVDQGYRLACQTSLPRGGTVWLPRQSRRGGQVILTRGLAAAPRVNPAMEALDLTVPLPTLEEPAAHRERLAQQLEPHLTGGAVEFPLAVLRRLPAALNAQGGRVTAALWMSRRVLDVAAGHGQPCLGLAVDLGTTTVVAYLMDLGTGRNLAVASAVNPQIALGEDVISRIAHAGLGAAQLGELGAQARRCINELALAACSQAGARLKRIVECVLVGNTAMHHLFLGLDPTGLAVAPYAPVLSSGLDLSAGEAGLEMAPGANLHWLPVKAGFVGADTVAVALALEADGLDEPTLILDLGTNGEMILAHSGMMLCCSTAAGPAFEGGHITWGMRGAPGAVEGVRLAPGLEPTLKVIGDGPPLGLCGSGIISAVAGLVRAGALQSNGSFAPSPASPRLRPGPQGMEFVLAWASQTDTGEDLVITARDVAEVQLAKAAVHAGVSIMLDRLGLSRVKRVLLAGAFGNYLDPEAACAIGLFPGVEAEIVEGVGNAAGAGAVAALLDRDQRSRARELADRMGYLELAACPDFPERFVEGLALPPPPYPAPIRSKT